MDKTGYMVAR